MGRELSFIVRYASQDYTESNMAMQMQGAFHPKFLVKMVRYRHEKGTYDENNHWVEGGLSKKNIWGRIKTGNKFSQFDEGESVRTEDGGTRFSDYRTLYVTDRFPLDRKDIIGFKGKYFNILQRSDESVFGFYKVLLEESEYWTP